VNEVLNHLWQSTVFAVAVGLACVTLRRNSPRLRYWLWLTASVKFLVPVSLIVLMGSRVQLPRNSPSLPTAAVHEISTYYSPLSDVTATPARARFAWPKCLCAIWLAGSLFLSLRWIRRLRTLRLVAHDATRLKFEYEVPMFSSSSTMGPGVLGLVRPVILLPEDLADRLTPEQFEAIVAHELRHIECCDNLTAALHMCVEVLFWFHPVVWWIGAKLMDERERDCDEAVLRQAANPETTPEASFGYAKRISSRRSRARRALAGPILRGEFGTS
jgi:bla regulator protein blaR1